MKRTLIVLSCCLVLATAAFAQDYRFAAGIRLSNSIPTLSSSFSGKYFITQNNAIEGLISFGNRFGLGALLEVHKSFNTPGLRWFYGGGAYVGFSSASKTSDGSTGGTQTYFGPTGIIGLDYKFPNIPLNLSLDWKPELDILPEISFVPEAFALSARFTFARTTKRGVE